MRNEPHQARLPVRCGSLRSPHPTLLNLNNRIDLPHGPTGDGFARLLTAIRAGRHAPTSRPATRPANPAQHRLQVNFTRSGGGLGRSFHTGERLLRDGDQVPLRPRELDALQAEARRALPEPDAQRGIGRTLYRLLFGASGGGDRFPDLAAAAWSLPPATTAVGATVAVELRADAGADAWLLNLPWHLTEVADTPLAAA